MDLGRKWLTTILYLILTINVLFVGRFLIRAIDAKVQDLDIRTYVVTAMANARLATAL